MKVEISKGDILERVYQLSEYVGSKVDKWEALRASRYDRSQLMRWVEEGLIECGNVLNRLLLSRHDDSDMAVLELRDTPVRPAEIKTQVEHCCALSVLVHWLKLVAPPLVEQYESDRERAVAELTILSYYRAMPV